MRYEQSMREYGNDKPDLRFGMQHVDLTSLIAEFKGTGVPMWQSFATAAPGQIVKALKVPANANFSRTETDKLEEIAKGMGGRGLARAKIGENGEWTQSPLAKSIRKEARDAINAAAGAQAGDILLFQFGKEAMVHTVLANLRLHLGKRLGLIPEYGTPDPKRSDSWKFLWVVDPPLFEYNEELKHWVAFLLAGAESLRELIPFPKTQRGTDLMTDAPGDANPEQLRELHIAVTYKPPT